MHWIALLVWALQGLMLVAIFAQHPHSPALHQRRVALLLAGMAFTALVIAQLELLGSFRQIHFLPVVSINILILLGLGYFVPWRANWATQFRLPKFEKAEGVWIWVLTGLTTLGLVILLHGALHSIPSNWDGMTYHMGRVANWYHNGNLAHYATQIERQVVYTPGAEQLILHLQVLAGGSDVWAALPQCLGMFLAVVGASCVAAELGGSRITQACAALLALTLPMGIMQSQSVQNDLLCAGLLLQFVLFLLRFHNRKYASDWIIAALALGLSLAVKSTTLLWAFPFGLWLATLWLIHARSVWKWRSAFQIALLGIFLLILPSSGHFYRNYQYQGRILGDDHDAGLKNQPPGLQAVTTNALRNVGNHLQTPLLAKPTEQFMVAVHQWFGWDISDPRFTFGNAKYEVFQFGYSWGEKQYPPEEDHTGNPYHLLAFVAALLAYPWIAKRLPPSVGLYLLCCVIGYLFFCLMLRWQPWHARLTLPWFVVLAPVTAIVWQRAFTRYVLVLLALFLVYHGVMTLNTNQRHPWPNALSYQRPEGYFERRPELQASYVKAADYLVANRLDDIGLILADGDTWEYPLHALLQAAGMPYRVRQFEVNNRSKALVDTTSPAPKVFVRINNADRNRITITHDGKTVEFVNPQVK